MTQTTAVPKLTEAKEHDLEADQKADSGTGNQPVALAMTFDDLLAGDDAPDETAEDMVRAVRAWRDTPVRAGLD